jgi:dTDP-4-dehydrorhamnose reductase
VRLLLLGAGGQVGRAVVKAAPAGHPVIAKSRSELDIADARAVDGVCA